jgi:hypothetical protein
MKQNMPLQINIPNPCKQDWGLMSEVDNGKHCTHCNNIVYDFSQMNDEELLNFFKQQPATHCGRFHNTQLNREILPVITRKKLLPLKFNKIAAALFTVLSYKAFPSQAGNKNDKPSIAFDANFKSTVQTVADKIIISGTITDVEGKPLEKATVAFDSVQVAVTDAEGKFSFELRSVTVASHNLYFSYGDLITAVRNYHPAMLSTGYDIKLYKAENIGTMIMGVMEPPGESLGEVPSLAFKNNVFKLSVDNKVLLATIAAKIKAIPYVSVTVLAYPPTCGRNLSIYQRRVDRIKAYLVEKEGISADRITTNCEVDGGDKNTVDIKSN